MPFRRTTKVLAVATLASALALGAAGTASAAPYTDLTGKGCPGEYDNGYGDGQFQQVLSYTFTAGNGQRYGHYLIYWINWSGKSYQGSTDYRCY
ncbi:hypothetical protein ACFY00_20265 [Kitasatospora sp. NPDC001540]|uniref:hypothetical protein n=1 Tax=Kitasatospora sp. NPDC001540 TaxID=3364014 RepID=UPI0036B6DEAF